MLIPYYSQLGQKKELEKEIVKIKKAAGAYGLHINEDKTKYVIMKQATTNEQRYSNLVIDTKTYKSEKLNHFEDLGVTITRKACKAMGSLTKLLKSKEVSTAVKNRIYRSVIRPRAMYGSEAWILTKKNKRSVRKKNVKVDVWYNGNQLRHIETKNQS